MNALRKNLMIGLTVLGMSTAAMVAHADDGGAAGRNGHQVNLEQMQAKMAAHFAKQQAKLHDLLKLTAAQEGAWTTYQAAIKPAAPAARPAKGSFAALSAPDRLSKMIDMSQQRVATMQAHLTALNAFYATLSADQQKTFNDNTMGGANAHHRHGGWHHG